MDMIGYSAHAEGFRTFVAANSCEVRMHSRSDVDIKSGVPVSGAKNDVNHDLTEGLRHPRIITEEGSY
jgi:hypothetical protein